MDRMILPANEIPSFRTQKAIKAGVEKNLLFVTWGGLGDQICAEPTLRYVLKNFKGCDISLETEHPELFSHLQFKEVFSPKSPADRSKYLVFETIVNPERLTWEFMSHMVTHCVDFCSLCSLRFQLPIADKEIKLVPPAPRDEIVRMMERIKPKAVVIHAGKHWQSKTFPKWWWDRLIVNLVAHDRVPILIGADTDDNRTTVDVDASQCVDLRNKLSIMESVWLCQNARVVLTNDSSPLHMAASGDAWIGFVATCKHPDYITHWRHGVWGWRMKNFGLGGVWDLIDYCPNKEQTVTVEDVGDENLLSWLPQPEQMALWAIEKTKSFTSTNTPSLSSWESDSLDSAAVLSTYEPAFADT